MRGSIALLRDRRGAAVLEFALLAPVFLASLFVIIEGGRLVWMQQLLRQTAFSAVRCAAIDTVNCATEAQRKNYAVARAARSGTRITASAVTITPGAVCNGNGGSNQVTISVPFNSPVAGLLGVPATVTASACFPAI